jgi:radical SAM protein with 4Fe4S-binding SPASM domain
VSECNVHGDGPATGSGRYTHGAQLLGALASKRGAPVGMHLQVADRCNHACAHCYQIQGLKGELSLDQVKAVIDDMAAAGVLTLNVSGGEATLRPDLLDILRHARARGFAVRLYTNAFLVDDALADALAAVGLHEVHVSLYSTVAAEHDAVTRVPNSWERTVRGVKALRARKVRVILKCPMVALAPEGAAGVRDLAVSLGCGFAGGTDLTAMEDGNLAPLAVAADATQLRKAGLLKGWTPAPDEADRRRERLGHAACGVGATGLVVLPNGDVLPCTDTPVVMGNLTAQRLPELLGSAPEVPLFRGLTLADVHGCRDCDLLTACKRCHATALHEGGDYLGPYPSACARARARYAAGLGVEAVTVLPPDPGCAPDRDPNVGPYALEGDGRLRPVADVITPEDDARAARFAWMRTRDAGASQTLPAQLVPLRLGRAAAAR